MTGVANFKLDINEFWKIVRNGVYDIVGTAVLDEDGKSIGKVKTASVDPQTGAVVLVYDLNDEKSIGTSISLNLNVNTNYTLVAPMENME